MSPKLTLLIILLFFWYLGHTFDSDLTYVGTEFGDSQFSPSQLPTRSVPAGRPFHPLKVPQASPLVFNAQATPTPTSQQATRGSTLNDQDCEHKELRIFVVAKNWEWETIDSGRDQQKKMMNRNGK
jgi:hypothetical protein